MSPKECTAYTDFSDLSPDPAFFIFLQKKVSSMEENLIVSPIKAIRAKRLDCNTTSNEVKLCPVNTCALWPFRFGKNPYRKGREYTEEERKAVAERLSAWRKAKDTTEEQGDD